MSKSLEPADLLGDDNGIGVAVSGGGHRGAAWALGAIAALVDTGLHQRIVSVASVSGGSIANGVLANAEDDLSDVASIEDYAASIAPSLRIIADEGLFPIGPTTKGWFRVTHLAALAFGLSLIGLASSSVAAGRSGNLWWWLVAGLALGCVAAFSAGGVKGYQSPKAKALRERPVRILVAPCLLGIPAAAWAGAASVSMVPRFSGIVVIAAWLLVLIGSGLVLRRCVIRRGEVVRAALNDALFSASGAPTMLAGAESKVNHVVCATDLESGDHFYLAPSFLHGYREGTSTSATKKIELAEAVQASAALPAVFPPVVVQTGEFTRDDSVKAPAQPPSRVVLADGGVYDNMGDQWEKDLRRRIKEYPAIAAAQTPARIFVLANASADWEWKPFNKLDKWISREVTALSRDQGVQYDVSTGHRRWALIREFRATEAELREAARNPKKSTAAVEGMIGTIAMIDRSPETLASAFAGGKSPRALRAAEAIEHLKKEEGTTDWEDMRHRNAAVATTLDAIGADATLDLLHHAYVMVMVGLYVIHGLGELRKFPREIFEAAITKD